MKIYYDFEIKHQVIIDNLPGLKHKFFNRVRELITDRFSILGDDIKNEESKNETTAIILNMLNPKEPSIFYQDYSKKLTERMIESCDNEYFRYVVNKVSDELGLSGLNFLN